MRELHWTREQAVVPYAASMGCLAVACMSLQTGSKTARLALSILIGMVGTVTSMLGYLTILPQWFVHCRAAYQILASTSLAG